MCISTVYSGVATYWIADNICLAQPVSLTSMHVNVGKNPHCVGVALAAEQLLSWGHVWQSSNAVFLTLPFVKFGECSFSIFRLVVRSCC